MRLLYLEDDRRDVQLLQLHCEYDATECEITSTADRDSFVKALQSGRYEGILSDSSVFNLSGPDAVRLARSLAPNLPYVFLCGTMTDERRAELLAAKPDAMFSKDDADGIEKALRVLRERSQR